MTFRSCVLCFIGVLILLLAPHGDAWAAVYVDNKTFENDEVWTAKAGPYYVSGNNRISPGVLIRVGAGTKILFQTGTLEVTGRLKLEGTEPSPIQMSLDQNSNGLSARGGTVDIDHVSISGGRKLIDAYASSEVIITNSQVKDMGGFPTAVSVFDNSSLVIRNTSFSNIGTGSALEIFQGSTASIEQSSFIKAGLNRTLQVFNGGPRVSSVRIDESAISECLFGVEAFDGSIVSVSNSEFRKCSGGGLLIHSNASVEISSSTVAENQIGIEQYFASTSISASIIEKNTEHGAYVHGGTFDSDGNWWGSESGPYSVSLNPQGQGNSVTGGLDPRPWLTESPRREPCCSSVLFIPGFQGSRLYKKSGIFENQLWEPNRNTDVKKLYLSGEGVPVESSIYAKDVIGRTNIGFGFFDKDIYDPIMRRLNLIKGQEKISAWQSFPYDWRLDPSAIVQSDILAKIEALAKTSKSKKVTLLAHSYGGIVAQKIAEEMQKKGKGSLIDRVVLVAVPEQGSMEAVAALLHGDSQSVAGGLILKKHIARTMGLNSPSSYYLLPKEDLFTAPDAPFIEFKASKWFGQLPNASSLSSLEGFVRMLANRPHSAQSQDTVLPAVFNSVLYGKMVTAGSSAAKLPAHVNVFNIIGTGTKTLRGISYVDKGCGIFSSIVSLADPYCGFNHRPLFTDKGDGTVPVGNLQRRLGAKIVFDVGAFNEGESRNISHSDILTAFPVLDKVEYILTHRGTTTLNQSVAYMEEVTGSESSVAAISRTRDAYQFIAVPNNKQFAFLEIANSTGSSTGIKKEHASTNGVMPVQEIPNSSYRNFGSSAYVLSDQMPKTISASLDDAGSVTVEANKISAYRTELVFEFRDIPVIEESELTVSVGGVPGNPTFELKIDFDGNGTVDERILYATSTPSGSQGPSSTSTQVLGGTLPSPEAALQIIKREIASSSVSKKFKERYLLKIKPIEASLQKGKGAEATRSTLSTVQSLASIVKELSRAKAVYYRGGMSYPEASYLYARFSSLYMAFRQAFP